MKTTIEFSKESRLQGYVLDGIVYYSKSDVGNFLGLHKAWAGRTIGKPTKAGRYLSDHGYQDDERILPIPKKDGSGGTTLNLIKGEQLDLLVGAAALSGSTTAVTLLMASFAEVRTDRERAALKLAPQTLNEKQRIFNERAVFYKEYAASLTEADWKNGDRVVGNLNPTALQIAALTEAVEIYYPSRAEFIIEAKDKTIDYSDLAELFE